MSTETAAAPAAETTAAAPATETAPAVNPQAAETATATETTTATTEAKPDEARVEGAPEKYADFTMPEGMDVDTAALEGFAPVAKELNLTQEQAQKLVDYYAGRVKAQTEGAGEAAEKWYGERRAAEIAQANETGIAAIKADAEIGGPKFDSTKARIDEAIGAVGTPELRAKFDTLGLGNDPDLVRLVNRLIDYTPQDRGERGGGAGGAPDKTYAQILYGNNS